MCALAFLYQRRNLSKLNILVSLVGLTILLGQSSLAQAQDAPAGAPTTAPARGARGGFGARGGRGGVAANGRVVSQSPTVAKQPSEIPTLYIVGDAAAANWGTAFPEYFDPAKIKIVNNSADGNTSRATFSEAPLEAFVAALRIGDVVLIQLGEHDSDDIKDAAGRGSIRGIGEEMEQVTRNDKPEFVHSYGWYMRDAIGRIRAMGALPILLTETAGGPSDDAVAVAKQIYAPLLDVRSVLTGQSGKDGKAAAEATVATLRALKLAASAPKFDNLLSDKGKAIKPADAKYALANILPGTEPDPNSKLDLQPFAYRGNIDATDPQWDAPTTPKTGKVVLALAGDSTVTYTQGYAAGFKSHLDKQLQVVDFSRGGATTTSFRAQSRWDWVIALKPDYVMIQFGHNDGSRNLPLYQSDLERFIDEARAAGIKPILVTPISRRYFEADGKIHSDLLQNVEVMKKVAAEKNVLLMNLHQAAINFYEKVGKPVTDTWGLKKDNPELSTAPNPDAIAQKVLDKTHFNPNGSAAIGKVVSDELKRAVPDLAGYIE